MGFNDKTFRLVVAGIKDPENQFVKDLGLKVGDELVSFNGKEISFENMRGIFGSYKNQIKKGDTLELVVARINDKGVESKEKLNAVITETKTEYNNDVVLNENLNPQQQALQNAWLGK